MSTQQRPFLEALDEVSDAVESGAGLPDSKVVARETVAAMGAALSDPRVAARQLGVQQVVCGELRAVTGGWGLGAAVFALLGAIVLVVEHIRNNEDDG